MEPAEREWNTFFGWSGTEHARLHFRTDNKLPIGASHHQKVVVVDGCLGFARTFSEYEDFPEIREVEELHLRIIRKAARYLYIENQYLSSHRIADALCDRLRNAEGPERPEP